MRRTQLRLLYNLAGFEFAGESVYVNGWLTHRDQTLTHLSLLIDGIPWVTKVPLTDRPDVLDHFKIVAPESLHSGIAIAAPASLAASFRHTLTFIPIAEEKAVGEVRLTVRNLQQEELRLPVPPFELAQRVGQHAAFLLTGQRIFNDIKDRVQRHIHFANLNRVLDWGCGSGRITRYLMEEVASQGIYACDIDKSAIEWSQRNIEGPAFQQIPAVPPTLYASGFFDLIYGISIFTHLSEEMQRLWLKELRRIIRPGGIVAVSVLNELFAPEALQPVIQRNGIVDEISPQSSELAEYSTADYYRVTYHSPEYIVKVWSEYFELLEYVEFGINSDQDLIIMTTR